MLRDVIFYTFGLKSLWLENCLKNFFYCFHNELGHKQQKALINYLKKMELYYKKRPTDFFKILYDKQKNYWSYLWINLYNNTNLFKIWGLINKGNYPRLELLIFLIKVAKFHNKSVDSGLNSLISTFEYTSIGKELKIGIVTRENNKRFVKKEGGYFFDLYVILYALYKFAYKNNVFSIDIEGIENELYSPQKILVIESSNVKTALFEINESELLQTDIEDDRLITKLNYITHPYDVLKKCIQKEQL